MPIAPWPPFLNANNRETVRPFDRLGDERDKEREKEGEGGSNSLELLSNGREKKGGGAT